MSSTTAKKTQLTKEEELLLQDSSYSVSKKSSALFYSNATIVAAVPIWLFWRIHQMEPSAYFVYFILATLGAAYGISFAYKNVKHVLKHKIAQKREEAITKEIMAKFSDKTKYSKQDKDDKILKKKRDVSEFEATTYSIFYNNSLFLVILLASSFLLFKNFNPAVNYVVSMGLASGLVALFSTGSK